MDGIVSCWVWFGNEGWSAVGVDCGSDWGDYEFGVLGEFGSGTMNQRCGCCGLLYYYCWPYQVPSLLSFIPKSSPALDS